MGVTSDRLRWLALIAGLTAVCGISQGQQRPDLIRSFHAVYALYNGDERVGQSEFSLTFDPSTRRYTFESRSEFRGWLRLLSPRPIVERSEFLIANGRIQPQSFGYEDGSRRGRRNFELRFNSKAGTVDIHRDETLTELRAPAGTLDLGTMRVALMMQLALDAMRGSFDIADRDGIEHYEFQVEGRESTDTGLGTLTAQRVRVERPDSSRRTLIWAAPDLRYLTARMEQHREGRDRVAFVLESVEWLDAGETVRPSTEQ